LETFLVNSVDPSPSVPVLAGELEIAYKRYKAPEYAWILSSQVLSKQNTISTMTLNSLPLLAKCLKELAKRAACC